MKERLRSLLVCPLCRSEVTLEVFTSGAGAREDRERDDRVTGDEVLEGRFACGACGADYPVIDGIPRMLHGPVLDQTLRRHPAFIAAHGHRFRSLGTGGADAAAPLSAFDDLQLRTQRSFSYEWTRFPRMHAAWERNFDRYISPPLDRSFFAGKLGLDAGCGMGRHMHYAARYGAEMVGVDLGLAADVAARNNRDDPRTHVVQADLYKLPFRDATFDFVESFGVLHHLPDPEGGFRGLPRLLKPGSLLMIYVYRRPEQRTPLQRVKHQFKEEVLRANIGRLPHPLIRAACQILGAGSRVLLNYPYLVARSLAPGAPWLERFSMRDYADYPMSVTVNDLFDWIATPRNEYYDREEVLAWFERAGLRDVQVLNHYGWRGFGRTPVAESRAQPGAGEAVRCAE